MIPPLWVLRCRPFSGPTPSATPHAANLADKYGTKKSPRLGGIRLVRFLALTGMAHNVYHIMIARFGVGIGEARIFNAHQRQDYRQ